MKSFLIADILGEDNDKEMKMQREECDDCKSARSEKGKSPSAKTKGNRKCGDVHESSCLPSWRRKFTEGQTTNLEEIFLRQKYITGKERAEIANTLGLTTKQVKTWFQNRRTKWKREKQRNAYGAEFFRQDGCLSLTEDLQRGVDRYARCCELPYVPVNDWGCYVMSNTLPVPVPVSDIRR